MGRVFLALDVLPQIKRYGHKLAQHIVQQKIIDAVVVKPELIHISILFLGEITDEQLEHIYSVLNNVSMKNINLTVGPMGYSWAHHHGLLFFPIISQDLEHFYTELSSLLSAVYVSERSFWPHCTLARIKKIYDEEKLEAFLSKQNQMFSYQADEYLLMQSVLTQQGPEYTILHRWKFE